MNLPPEAAAILRTALHEAEHLSGFDDRKAYAVLSEAVDNLLAPEDDTCYCGSPMSSHRLGDVEHSYQRRPQPGDPVPVVGGSDLDDLPF